MPIVTLRELSSLPSTPSSLGDSVLVMIDCQNTYRTGTMALVGVEPALVEARALLDRARAVGTPIVHVQHDAGPGAPYDLATGSERSRTSSLRRTANPSSSRRIPMRSSGRISKRASRRSGASS